MQETDPKSVRPHSDASLVRVVEQVLASITDFAYTFDRDGRFTYANRALLDLWGLTLEQAIGKNFFDLNYPPELAARLQQQIQQVIQTKQTLADETPYTSPTGSAGVFEYIFTPVLDAGGSVQLVAGSTRDISARKRLEEDLGEHVGALQAERANLVAVIERAPAFICMLRGPQHRFEMANERYYELVGRRDIIGRPVIDVLPEVVRQGFLELLDRVFATGEPFIGSEVPVVFREAASGANDEHIVNFVYQALRDSAGNISGIFVHGVDVTETVRVRDALRESNAAFRQLADAMPQIVWAARADGVLDYYNRRWFEYIDVPISAASEATWDRFIHRDDLPAVYEAWATAVRDGTPYAAEFRVRRADGMYRWFLVRAEAVRDSLGNVTRWFGTCTDIHDQKQLQEQNERLLESERAFRAEAESANRAKDRFLAVLSHELRTPLSPVVMTIPSIERDPELPEKFREDLAMVRRNIELEVKLIDDLLDLSRVTSGKLRLQIQPMNAHDVLRHAMRSSLSEVSSKRLSVREALHASNDRLSADPARMQQVFWNLLRNAAKFTPIGGEIAIRTWNSDDGAQLFIQVSDSGVGIEPEMLARIFEAFEQGNTRVTREFGGLGLGLAIAKAVVEMHGGTIGATSDGRDRGATFTIAMATASVRPAMTQPSPSDDPLPAGAVQVRSRVMLVEDHPDTARILARLLRGCGFDVKTAGSVASALQLAAAETFDVVVSDIGLPDATGYELMAELRDRYHIKGIALSGYGMEDDMRKSRAAGFVDHVVKPVNVAQLQAVICRVVAGEISN